MKQGKQGKQGKGRLCPILDTPWQEIVEVPQVVVEERVVHVPGSSAYPSGNRWALTVVGKSLIWNTRFHKIIKVVWSAYPQAVLSGKKQIQERLIEVPKVALHPRMGADIKFAVVLLLLLLLLLLLPLPVPVVVLVLLLLLLRGMKIWIRVICFCWLILYVSCSFVHQAVHSGHTQRRASLVQQFPEHLLSWPSTTLRQQPPFPIPPKQAMATAKDWVERVEYEDYVEYREVPVDKIIEASLPMDLSAVGDNLNTDLALEPPPWWPMMIYDDLRWSMRFDEWSMMIYDDAWWSMMIHDYRWQSIMIHDDLSMIHDDRWWSMMTYDNLWGSMMIHDDLWWSINDSWWPMMIYDNLWGSMMIHDDLSWFMMTDDDLWWSMIFCMFYLLQWFQAEVLLPHFLLVEFPLHPKRNVAFHHQAFW